MARMTLGAGNSWKGGYSRTYQSWATMKQRCTNPKTNRFKHYGGRGIAFCEAWKVFDNFLVDMGDTPIGMYAAERRSPPLTTGSNQ